MTIKKTYRLPETTVMEILEVQEVYKEMGINMTATDIVIKAIWNLWISDEVIEMNQKIIKRKEDNKQ